MSGLPDEFYKAMTEFYKDGRLLDRPKPYYNTGGCYVCVLERVIEAVGG